MKKLYVYADFDWLKAPKLIGELSYDSVRGNDTYGFEFDKEWLADYDGLFLRVDCPACRLGYHDFQCLCKTGDPVSAELRK